MTAEARASQAAAPLVRRATVADVEAIHRIVNHFADRDEMLHRSHNELYEHLRDYFVAEAEGQVAGCVALHVQWKDLAELKALAVDEVFQGRGLGKALARAVLDDARRLGIAVVYALTYRPTFFEELGFRVVPMALLPRKVWGECYRCPKFNACYEVPVVYEVVPGAFPAVERPASAPIQLVPLWERPRR